MWPGFKSWHLCHMWVEFVVGSLLCSKRFSLGTPVFLTNQRFKFQFDQESGRWETTLWMCYPPNHIVIIIINIFSAINYCFLHSPRTGANPWSWGTRGIFNWWTATFSVCAQFLGWLWWWWWWWLLLELLDQSMSLDYNLLFLQPVIQAQSSPLHQRPFQRMKANSSL